MLKEIKTVRAFLSLFQMYPWAIPTIIVLGVLSSLAERFAIGLFIPFLQVLNNVAGSVSGETWFVDKLHQLFITAKPDQRLIIISICIFTSVLLKALLAFSNKAYAIPHF